MAFASLDPQKVIVIFNKVQIQGFVDSADAIKIAHANETWTHTKGLGRDSVRVRQSDHIGTATLQLMQSSEFNDVLQTMLNQDRTFGTGYGTFMIKDLNGSSLYVAETAWVVGTPESGFGNESNTREWQIALDDLQSFVGGAVL